MAKIKRRKLHWRSSDSPQVVGYKLYWSEGAEVDYDCPATKLGNVTEVLLPDDLPDFIPGQGPMTFGITAMDELGNESDMVTVCAEYEFNVPQAPTELRMEALDEFHATGGDHMQAPAETPSPQLYEKGIYNIADHENADENIGSAENDGDSHGPVEFYSRMDQA